MTSNKRLLLKRVILALLCACIAPLGALADDQNSSSGSSSQSATDNSSGTSGSNSSNSSTTNPSGSTSGSSGSSIGSSTGSSYSTSGTSGTMDTADQASWRNMTPQQFVTQAAIDGLKEVRLGELAAQKAQDSQVKQFAQRLVRDHAQANQQLTQIAQAEGLTLPATNLFAFMSTTGMGASSSGYQSGSLSGQSGASSSSSTSPSDQTSQGAGARDLNSISSGSSSGQGSSSSGLSSSSSGQSGTSSSDQSSTSGQGSSSIGSSSSNSGQGSSSSGLSSSSSGQSGTSSSDQSSSSNYGQGGASSAGQGSSSTLGQNSSSNWRSSQGQVRPQDFQMIRHLQSLSGSEFDKAYIRHMVMDHQKDIRKFEAASQNLQDAQLKNFAAQQLPTLQSHLSEAKQIASTLGISSSELQGSGQNWDRNRLNDREGQPRSSSDAGTSNR